jgi:hypothetical protein
VIISDSALDNRCPLMESDGQLLTQYEYKLAEKKRKEEAYNAEQLAKLEKYGNLTIMGSPLYASIKLNGETMYAPIGQVDSANLMNNTWREIRLKPGISNFQDLKIKQKISVEVSSSASEPRTDSSASAGSKAACMWMAAALSASAMTSAA